MELISIEPPPQYLVRVEVYHIGRALAVSKIL